MRSLGVQDDTHIKEEGVRRGHRGSMLVREEVRSGSGALIQGKNPKFINVTLQFKTWERNYLFFIQQNLKLTLTLNDRRSMQNPNRQENEVSPSDNTKLLDPR